LLNDERVQPSWATPWRPETQAARIDMLVRIAQALIGTVQNRPDAPATIARGTRRHGQTALTHE
jgi:hypothetical protein